MKNRSSTTRESAIAEAVGRAPGQPGGLFPRGNIAFLRAGLALAFWGLAMVVSETSGPVGLAMMGLLFLTGSWVFVGSTFLKRLVKPEWQAAPRPAWMRFITATPSNDG